MTDQEIESLPGLTWTGDYWKIEDADLHPLIRTIVSMVKQEQAESTRSQKLADAGYTRRPKGFGKEVDVEQTEPVPQFRKVGCANWYDGLPDQSDGGGPYESRTLYAAPKGQTDLLKQALEALERTSNMDFEVDSEEGRTLVMKIRKHLGNKHDQ